MATIDRNTLPTLKEIEIFLRQIDFKLPDGFINFFMETNGADINKNGQYIILWPLTDMIQLNRDYSVEEFAPDFFIFGSDGGDTAYAIEKQSGFIYEMPFIGMSREEAVFCEKNFIAFVEDYEAIN